MQELSIKISDGDAVRLGLKGNSSEMKLVQDKMQELGQIFLWLNNDEQEALLKMLRKRLLLNQANRLNQSVITNTISMQEIVDEVLKVRQSQS